MMLISRLSRFLFWFFLWNCGSAVKDDVDNIYNFFWEDLVFVMLILRFLSCWCWLHEFLEIFGTVYDIGVFMWWQLSEKKSVTIYYGFKILEYKECFYRALKFQADIESRILPSLFSLAVPRPYSAPEQPSYKIVTLQ